MNSSSLNYETCFKINAYFVDREVFHYHTVKVANLEPQLNSLAQTETNLYLCSWLMSGSIHVGEINVKLCVKPWLGVCFASKEAHIKLAWGSGC